MSERLIAASFEEALELFTHKYGPLYGKAPDLYGADDAPMGYHARSDVGERSTVDGTPLSTMWDDFTARLALFNRQADGFVSKVTFPVTVTNDRVAIPRRARMEPATEFGQPTLIRTERVARAYYLNHYDLGFGFTLEFLDDATDAEIVAIRSLAEEAYSRRMRQEILEILFESSNFTDTKEGLNIKKLYNADGEIPPEYEGYTHDGTHTHYLYTAGTSLASTDVDAMETHLVHHGYGDRTAEGAGGNLELHVPRGLISTVRGFTGYIPAATASILTELDGSGVIVGRTPGSGEANIEGYYGRFAVIENNSIPAGYVMGLATGGAFAVQNPVGLRRHRNPSAQGLRLNPGRRDYPLQDSFYDMYVGGGVRHRGAAALMYVDTGSGSAWVDPTF